MWVLSRLVRKERSEGLRSVQPDPVSQWLIPGLHAKCTGRMPQADLCRTRNDTLANFELGFTA